MKLFIFMSTLILSSCYGAWDVPATPLHDECSNTTSVGYIYVYPCKMNGNI